jgi:hypothetical protein
MQYDSGRINHRPKRIPERSPKLLPNGWDDLGERHLKLFGVEMPGGDFSTQANQNCATGIGHDRVSFRCRQLPNLGFAQEFMDAGQLAVEFSLRFHER